MVANRAVNLFNDNVTSHFKKILQRRQKQQILDKFLMKEKKETQEKDLSKPNRQRIEETPLELPEVFMERDSPSKKWLISFFPSLRIKKGVHKYNTVLYHLNLH